MSDCIFCKIRDGQIPSKLIYEDDKLLVFHDVEPQAPVHALMIPKKHVKSLDDLKDSDEDIAAYMLLKIKEIAELLGLEEGYRVVINTGKNGLQTVEHLHFHILGKRLLTWPPG